MKYLMQKPRSRRAIISYTSPPPRYQSHGSTRTELRQRITQGRLLVEECGQEDVEAVHETRQWVFLKDGDASAAQSSTIKKSTGNKPTRDSVFQHSINLTPTALFRYSALIFNSHAIHLSKEHCLKEGHPNLVVHGPLTFSLLLEAARLTIPKRWKTASYRAVGPAYVGDTITLNVGVEKDGKADAWAETGHGLPVMNVTIEFW